MKKIIKGIVPQSIVHRVRNDREKLSYYLSKVASKTKVFSNMYYLFSNKFSSEHQAVLKGKVAYYDSLNDIGKSCALLRRNIHRLEKGLIMRPRRSIFAEGFIEETVLCYKDAMHSTILASEEKKWATDVLNEYFQVVGSAPVIDIAKKIYKTTLDKPLKLVEHKPEFPSGDESFKPYPYQNLPDTNVSYDELKQLFIRRRSVRWYQDKEVPPNLVQKAANIASFAPSACNRQPYRFMFCNDKKKTVSIAKCAGGTSGFAENLPAIVAIVGDLSAYPYERDRHLIYIDGSLAAMQLMLALETLGLSSCSINWPDIEANEKKIRKVIELKSYERVVMLLAVGYADTTGGIPYSQKKENSLILEDIS